MSRRLALILLLALCAAAPLAAGPALTPMANVTMDSDGVVQVDGRAQVITAHDPSRIRVQLEGDPKQRLLIKAPDMRLDLRTQSVWAAHGVKLVTPQAFVTGDSLSLGIVSRTFTMDQALVVLNLAAPGAPVTLGEMRGQRLSARGTTLTIDHGMISPSADEHPDIDLSARRLVYNEATHHLRLYGSRLDFYGLHIPIIPTWETNLGGPPQAAGVLPGVAYSNRDGISLPYSFNFTPGRLDLDDTLKFSLTQKRGITFLGQTGQTKGQWDLRLWASRLEDVRDKLVNNLQYDRLPEFVATGYEHGATQHQGWKAEASLGQFREYTQLLDVPPVVDRERALLGVGYCWGGRDLLRQIGQWASVWSTGAVYNGGEHYFDSSVTLGSGRRFSPSFQADLQYIHHFQDGLSPFQFDRVDIPHELRPEFNLQLTNSWHLESYARYDAGGGRLRDYHFDLSKRMHALTWHAYYTFIGASSGVRVDINGLTGGTAPPPLTSPLALQYLQAEKELAAP